MCFLFLFEGRVEGKRKRGKPRERDGLEVSAYSLAGHMKSVQAVTSQGTFFNQAETDVSGGQIIC